jgi:anti-repressor protein
MEFIDMTERKNSTGTSNDGSPFPAIIETVVGAGLVQTTNGRDLHRFLQVGRDFSTWMSERLTRYGFVENVDYVRGEDLSSPNPGISKGRGGARPQRLAEYHLTLDTAKEIAMVENNEQGRAARRYFIECERRAKAVSLDARVIGGVTKGVIAKAIGDLMPDILAEALTMMLPALVREQVATRQHAVIEGISAGQVLEMAGYQKRKGLRGIPAWLSHRLRRFHAHRGVAVRLATLGSSNAYVFDPLVSREWLSAGGKAELDQKVAERRGQGALRLV